MNDRPLLLDLFCGAGGAAVGYHRAGFEVVGVDIHPQPHYPFEFVQADAMTYPLDGFDAYHASPPCQAFTRARVMQGRSHPDLLTPTRERLRSTGRPWVVENVVGAPMPDAVTVCAASLLRSDRFECRRHRLFEASFALMAEPCSCGSLPPVYAYGHSQDRAHRERYGPCGADERRAVLGVEWMNRDEAAASIPPALTELIGWQLLAVVQNETRAAA